MKMSNRNLRGCLQCTKQKFHGDYLFIIKFKKTKKKTLVKKRSFISKNC